MTNLKRIYIAGPMTGMPEHNFPAFHAAAERFRRPVGTWSTRPRTSLEDGPAALDLSARRGAAGPVRRHRRADRLGAIRRRDAEAVLASEIGLTFFDAFSGQQMAKPPRTSFSARMAAMVAGDEK